ncbi:MAG TPA: polysaccharide biosynthesis/export family protein [Gemmataceae bacterium]|nr:polysaccharide biosynthesis/export family protein [Gemmataceae bacterium]
MQAGQGRSCGWGRWLLAAALGLAVGCVSGRSRFEQALLADRTPAAHGGDSGALYAVHCPDVLELNVVGRPDWDGRRRVGPDGFIGLGDAGPLRVDGLRPSEIAAAVAERAGVPAERVHVRVAAFNSQQVYVFGEVAGSQRAVPYRGPETVLDLLQRAGGLSPAAAPTDVQVVRAHVADGKTPEVFHVDLAAIVLKHDQHSNVRLLPFDQVYVGQSRRSTYVPAVPPWLRPVYHALCGMWRPKDGAKPPPAGNDAKTPASPAPAGRPVSPARQRDAPRHESADGGVVPAE